MKILDGKKISNDIKDEISKEVNEILKSSGSKKQIYSNCQW